MEDSKRKTSLLKDNSWIRRVDDEDGAVDPEGDETTNTVSSSTSVQALTKRFGGSQDELKNSTAPLSRKSTSSYSKSIFTEQPKTSTTTTTVTKDGKTTETTITTSQTVRSPVSKSSTKTETFTERVKSSSKGSQYSYYSPTKTTKVTETTVTSDKDAEDKLYDTLIPSSIKGDFSAIDGKTSISKTETVIVKSSNDTKSGIETTNTTRIYSNPEDDLYGTLMPRVISTNLSSPVSSSVSTKEIITVESSRSSYSDDIPSTRSTSYTISTKPSIETKTYSYSRPESSYDYTSVSSPTVYTSSSYKSSSRSDENLTDPIYSKSSIKSVYASERPVLEKDLCTICRKPFTGDAKIVLDDIKINCHASCFKCDVCNSTLSHLKAGDSMWVYKRMVHCDNCFEITRDKWRR
ncbi:sciellin isoform X2 [Mastacembelus armatus]|uniref:Sciellin n=1 Tax=Mastacembelus armatus TaxID=205130 RepID=A0A3Q3SK76_9TELE|nr:sciellin isoform X2 [Mastacembelus armatus]